MGKKGNEQKAAKKKVKSNASYLRKGAKKTSKKK
jgi:hypothetical protein